MTDIEMLAMTELFTHPYKGDGEVPCTQWFTLTNVQGAPTTGRCNRWPKYHAPAPTTGKAIDNHRAIKPGCPCAQCDGKH